MAQPTSEDEIRRQSVATSFMSELQYISAIKTNALEQEREQTGRCVCLCVCERERERKRDDLFLPLDSGDKDRERAVFGVNGCNESGVRRGSAR